MSATNQHVYHFMSHNYKISLFGMEGQIVGCGVLKGMGLLHERELYAPGSFECIIKFS